MAAVLGADGAVGGGASSSDEGLIYVMEALPEFDPKKEVTYNDLQLFTDNFRKENRLVRTQFGVLYRGKIPQGWRGIDEKNVAVKMWETKSFLPSGRPYYVKPEYLLDRVKDEIRFMSLPFLQNLQIVGKVLHYCFELNTLGVVYDVNPLGTVFNFICDKDKFGWANRVKVAIGLARFLKFCHDNVPSYLVRNLCAQHVVLDQDFNPVLVDFAMVLGGGIGDDSPPGWHVPVSSYCYEDSQVISVGMWSVKTDVFTFGVILLELILGCTSIMYVRKKHCFLFEDARGVYKRESQLEEAKTKSKKVKKSFWFWKKKKEEQKEVKTVKCSFVNKHLELDPEFHPDDGAQLTMLAVRCVDVWTTYRPRIDELVLELEKLHVVIKHGGVP